MYMCGSHRLEQALTKADGAMGFTEIARDLLSDDKEKQLEAAKKYTLLTDSVTDRILECTELSEVITYACGSVYQAFSSACC